jgi:hypothetical protein
MAVGAIVVANALPLIAPADEHVWAGRIASVANMPKTPTGGRRPRTLGRAGG